MSQYQSFRFKSYTFDPSQKTLHLVYGYDDALEFTETFRFNFEFAPYNESVLDQACQLLFFMAGVSYYKAYCAPTISIEAGSIDASLSAFLGQTYQRGLGEFFYVNNLDPKTPILFPETGRTLNMLSVQGQGSLVGLGGGKDSLVSVETLRAIDTISTWSVGHMAQLEPLVSEIGEPHYWVERTWDTQLLDINAAGAYNGHIPISAILACAGVVTAVLTGKRDVVVSNEQSANEPTLTYNGIDINHQYSKSSDFEQAFQAQLSRLFGNGIRYYSLLRPLSELRISELFATNAFTKYRNVFSSCNKAFTHDSNTMSWCGVCPKCAFVFLALTPFIEQEVLEQVFGKNLLRDTSLELLYQQLLGIEGDKPLECVGEIKESRSAMLLAFETYPELRDKYHFDIPTDYDWRAPGPHDIPNDIVSQLPFVSA